MFTTEEMRESIPRFLDVWQHRPIRNNQHGMGINHSWALWYLLDRLQPAVVLESGVWRGHSTWVIEQAAPGAQIYSFDVDLSNRRYVSARAEYFEHDLEQMDWSGIDTAHAVAFIDDHQDAYRRLEALSWLGFHHLVFEDNHPVGWGDFYTLKNMQAGAGYPAAGPPEDLRGRARVKVRDFLVERNLLKGRQRPVAPNKYHWANAEARMARYIEMPALKLGPTYYRGPRYEDLGERPTELVADKPLPGEDLIYNWLTYVELRP